MELRQIAENVWVSEDEMRMVPGVWLPVRMVVVRIESDLWVHSPVSLSDGVQAVNALGNVRWIVNPNGFHGAWASEAVEHWPDATLYSSPALGAKDRLPEFEPLDDAAYLRWAHAIDSQHVSGLPSIDESVFFHRDSKTLVVTDLLFNLQKKPRGVLAPLMFRLMGTWNEAAQSRLLNMFLKDRRAAAQSLEAIADWDFERIIMAHGDIIEHDAKRVFREATTRMRRT